MPIAITILDSKPRLLRFAVVFFVNTLSAAVFGFTGIAAISAASIAKILFFIFLIFAFASMPGGAFRR